MFHRFLGGKIATQAIDVKPWTCVEGDSLHSLNRDAGCRYQTVVSARFSVDSMRLDHTDLERSEAVNRALRLATSFSTSYD